MDADKQDLDEQIKHHQEMLIRLRRRLRARELQEAEYGINVPPEVTNELITLNERIATHEKELSRLKSVAAEGTVPLVEVEYRAALALAWDTPTGQPTVSGGATLELTRLQKGIAVERAAELERQTRVQLAEQALSKIGTVCLIETLDTARGERYLVCKRELPADLLADDTTLRLIGRALHLDTEITARTLASLLPLDKEIDLFRFAEALIRTTGETEPCVVFCRLLKAALLERDSERCSERYSIE